MVSGYLRWTWKQPRNITDHCQLWTPVNAVATMCSTAIICYLRNGLFLIRWASSRRKVPFIATVRTEQVASILHWVITTSLANLSISLHCISDPKKILMKFYRSNQAICIEFLAESIPWLLDEPCENRLFYPDMWWQTCKMRKERQFANIIEMMLRNDVEYTWRTGSETADHMEQWFQHFVPAEKQSEMRSRCFPRYLWHAFECVPCERQNDARNSFNSIAKKSCIVLLNNQVISFFVLDASVLTADIIDNFKDIFITDIDFRWTYVHTHEKYYGPYFFTFDR